MKNITIKADDRNQFSAFLMDHLKPIKMRAGWDQSLKKDHYLEPLKRTIDFIEDLGEAEHTGDWDPSLKVTYIKDGRVTTLETECGYWNFIILPNHISIIDVTEDNKEIQHTILITDLLEIEVIRN